MAGTLTDRWGRTPALLLTLVLVAAACSSTDKGKISAGAGDKVTTTGFETLNEPAPSDVQAESVRFEAAIGPEGGEGGIPGVVNVVIPAGALDGGGMLRLAPSTYRSDVHRLDGPPPVGIEIAGAEILNPIFLEFAYEPGTTPPTVIEYWDGQEWNSEQVLDDPERQVVVASVTHLSWWKPTTWCWGCLADSALQQMGRVLGSRAGPPTCSGSEPGWFKTFVVGDMAGSPLVVCGESEGETLVTRIVNNRGYWMVLHSDTGFQWAYSQWRGIPVNDIAHQQAPGVFGGGNDFVVLPPLTEVAIGLTRPSNGYIGMQRGATGVGFALTAIQEAGAKASDKIGSALVRLSIRCFLNGAPPANSGDAPGYVRGLIDCMIGTIQRGDAVDALTAEGLSPEEFVQVEKLLFALKVADWARIGAVGVDIYADSAGVSLGVRGQADEVPVPEQGSPDPTPPPTTRGVATTSPPTTAAPTTQPPATTTPTTQPTRTGTVNGCNTYGQNCEGNPIYKNVPPVGYDYSSEPKHTTVPNGTRLTARCWAQGGTTTNYASWDPGPNPYGSDIYFNVAVPGSNTWGFIPDTYFVRDKANKMGLPRC